MNIRCALLVAFFPLLTSAALQSAETAADAAAATKPEKSSRSARGGVLSNGDTVGFQIVEDKDGEMERRISDTGDLDVPYIGRVHVAGKTCDAAAADIKKRLEQDYYFQATVRLAINQVNRQGELGAGGPGVIAMSTVTVSGDSGTLRAAGPQPFVKKDKLTISAAILKAGPTIYANQEKVKLTRKNGGSVETTIINVDRILKGGKLDEDIDLRDGDYIYVPRKGIVF